MRLLGGEIHTLDGRMKGAVIIGTATVLIKFRLVVFILGSPLKFGENYEHYWILVWNKFLFPYPIKYTIFLHEYIM